MISERTKKMKKRLFTLLMTAVLAVLMLAACGESAASYATDVPVSKLEAAALAVLPADADLATVSEDYIKGMMKIDPSAFVEYVVKIQAAGANIDEFGIFKAPSDEAVESVKKIAEDYIAYSIDSWMPEYMPEEFPKMEKASVKVMGRYVVYCILDDDLKTEVFTAIENILLGK